MLKSEPPGAIPPVLVRKMLAQSLAVDQLGRDIVFAVYFADLINGQNVGMIQCRSGFRFLNKPIQFVRVLAEFFVQKFNRDFPIESSVLGRIDFTHSAGAEFSLDAVVRQSCVGFEFFIHHGLKIIPADSSA